MWLDLYHVAPNENDTENTEEETWFVLRDFPWEITFPTPFNTEVSLDFFRIKSNDTTMIVGWVKRDNNLM